jgi:hypothetical protein
LGISRRERRNVKSIGIPEIGERREARRVNGERKKPIKVAAKNHQTEIKEKNFFSHILFHGKV